MKTVPHHYVHEASAWLFWTVVLLFSVSTEVEGLPREERADAGSVEELLVTIHPVGKRGGRLASSLRSEVRTLNPVLAGDNASTTVIWRMMADLIHVNRYTQEVEPALAKAWRVSADGLRYTLELRRGIHFSDGHPFDADDVLFTFEVYQDEDVASPFRDHLIIGGRPITVRKIDSHTVQIDLPMPYGSGVRLFDGIAVLPRHKLEASYREGRFSDSWSVLSASGELAGLGPFRLKSYTPGQYCVLERNPYYWKVDGVGTRLPYLDEIVFFFVANQDAQVIRFQSGDADVINGLSAESFSTLERTMGRGRYELYDLGSGLDFNFLFFNLNDVAGRDLQTIVEKQKWFMGVAFRRAVSAAIDREAIARLVYHKRATSLRSHVPAGYRKWENKDIERPRRSLAEARELLEAAGFEWDKSNHLIDAGGKKVEFSIITSSSNSQRLKISTIIQADLKELGMTVRVVPMEHRAVIDRISRSFDFDACVMGLRGGDADPNGQLNVLLSSGNLNAWDLSRRAPSSDWEAEIDRLMTEQLTTTGFEARRDLYNRVQLLMAQKLPLIFLVAPHVLVGAKRELGNFKPAILDHSTLWNVDEIFWRENRAAMVPTGREGSRPVRRSRRHVAMDSLAVDLSR